MWSQLTQLGVQEAIKNDMNLLKVDGHNRQSGGVDADSGRDHYGAARLATARARPPPRTPSRESSAARAAAGRGACKQERAVVSPFTAGQPVRRHGSWLSPHVRRIRCRDRALDGCKKRLL